VSARKRWRGGWEKERERLKKRGGDGEERREEGDVEWEREKRGWRREGERRLTGGKDGRERWGTEG